MISPNGASKGGNAQKDQKAKKKKNQPKKNHRRKNQPRQSRRNQKTGRKRTMKEDCKKCDMYHEDAEGAFCIIGMEKKCFQRLTGEPVRIEPDWYEIARGITT